MEDKSVLVTIHNIKPEKGGQLIVFLFLEPGFPKDHEQSLNKFIGPVDKEVVRMEIQVPINCEFALKVFHDEMMDERIRKKWMGVFPKGGLGFSNGAHLWFGPPKFSSACIRYAEGMEPTIRLRYF